MDLTTQYLGMTLKNPLVVAASPLTQNPDNFKKLEDSGVAAIVKHSLFEEQITHEVLEMHHLITQGTESYAEALNYFPQPDWYHVGPDAYLDHIYKAKQAIDIPVIASLNGSSVGGWVNYAKKMEEAGADAIELNIYHVANDPTVPGAVIEDMYVDIAKLVKKSVQIPVCVKLSPFFSSLGHVVMRLERESLTDGIVLFNRFYQPDIDLEELEVYPNLMLSTSYDMRLPMRWIAYLYGHTKMDFAATSGIHSAEDVIKMMMAGANVAMLCAVLLKNGADYASKILKDLEVWMEEHEYDSIQQMQGSMSCKSCSNPENFARVNYIKKLQSYQ